jgi:tetratricopeptide (TPR) repeat protein
VDFYNKLPERQANEPPREVKARWEAALEKFKKRVGERYTEGTLVRLLESGDARTRQAALTALGLLGSMNANVAVAARLHDDDPDTRQLAADTLWSLWFRADSEENNQELQRLLRMRDREKALAAFDQLILRAPGFAEAYNQRAVLAFRLKQYERSIADCEKVLQLNPYHFGAQAGMAQCYLQLRKHKTALKAFRAVLRLNPHMEGVAETIRALENALGEEGRKDDKK